MRMDPMMRKDAAMRGKLLRFGPAARAARFSYVVRQQIRIPQSPLAASKLAPICAATNPGAKVCSRIEHGYVKRMEQELYEQIHPITTGILQTWEHGPTDSYESGNARSRLFPHPSYESGNTFPRTQTSA